MPVLDASRPAREWRLGAEGERQAGRLAGELRRFMPFRLAASTEPKAARTGELVAAELGLTLTALEGLRELDRPALPIMSSSEHQRLNAGVFTEFDRPVVGSESARDALNRFSRALSDLLLHDDAQNIVVIAHGTVIALLVAAHNKMDAFLLWKRLQCPSLVVLDAQSLEVLEVVDRLMFTLHPIGIVRSPYTSTAEIPKGLGAKHETEGVIEIRPDYEEGLADIEGFSHLYVIWVFDRAEGSVLTAHPPSDDRPHGVFSTRSPQRPNPIGLTVVELLGREGPRLRVRGIDMLDGTPVVDIKPYLSSVPPEHLRRGWLDEAERRRAQR